MKKNYFLIVGVLLLLLVGGYFVSIKTTDKNKHDSVNIALNNNLEPSEVFQLLKRKVAFDLKLFIGIDEWNRPNFILNESKEKYSKIEENGNVYHSLPQNHYFLKFSPTNQTIYTSTLQYDGNESVKSLTVHSINTKNEQITNKIFNGVTNSISFEEFLVLTDEYYGNGNKILIVDYKMDLVKKLNHSFQKVEVLNNTGEEFLYINNYDEKYIYDSDLNEVNYLSKSESITNKIEGEIKLFEIIIEDKNVFGFISNSKKQINIYLKNNGTLNQIGSWDLDGNLNFRQFDKLNNTYDKEFSFFSENYIYTIRHL